MIQLHFKAKARAFGVTLGTVEDSVDVTHLVSTLLCAVVPQGFKASVGSLALGRLPDPILLYDRRGAFIELR